MPGESKVDRDAIQKAIDMLKGITPAGGVEPKPEELEKADTEAEKKLHELHQAQFTRGK